MVITFRLYISHNNTNVLIYFSHIAPTLYIILHKKPETDTNDNRKTTETHGVNRLQTVIVANAAPRKTKRSRLDCSDKLLMFQWSDQNS